ncbi:MAG TPA: hypothetical protein VLK84_23985, partial [Longimicrobium sp.]|nr:hypothetical protein [Longimicrobium sp.]
HDVDGGLDRVTGLLDRQGFEIIAEQDEMYTGSRLYNLYAVRPRDAAEAAGGTLQQQARARAERQRHAPRPRERTQ